MLPIVADAVVVTRRNPLELPWVASMSGSEPRWSTISMVRTALTSALGRRQRGIYVELRRQGRTVRGIIDCRIAQIAVENSALLLHRDRNFEAIADIRP